MEEKIFNIKRGFSDHVKKELVFNESFLKFQDKDNINSLYTLIDKEQIAEYRYGIRWIKFEITYGREYQIYVRSKENKILKITFKSYFGRGKVFLNN